MANCRVLIFIVIMLSCLLTTQAAAAVDTGPDNSPTVAQAGSDTVTVTQTLQLNSETPGSIQVTTSADVSLKLKEFSLFVNESAKQVTVDGFRQTTAEDPIEGYKKYEWDGNTRSPSVIYYLNVNTTDGSQEYTTVDAGEWAIVKVPSIPYSWRASEEIEVVKNHEVAGPGVIKRGFAFLGEHEIRTRSANEQRFRLVIPEAANLTESPEAILDNVAYASKHLRVGARDKEVVMIAAPTSDEIQWAHGGTATGSIFWAQDTGKLDSPNNVWIHEYVHTRQGFERTDDFEWFAEGSAEYYAALFTLQQEQIGFEQFQRHLAQRETRYSNAILTNTKDSGFAQYAKGGLVAGRTDQQIRLLTNGSGSLTDIIRQLNADDKRISNAAFIRYVRLYSNDELESEVQAATTTSQSLAMWDTKGHAQAFGEEPHEVESPNTKKTEQDSNTEESNTKESNAWLRFIIALVAINGVVYTIFKIHNR